jgi:uncharacterized membrane protein YkoI
MIRQRMLLRSLLVGVAVAALPALASAAMMPGKDVQTNFQAAKVALAQAIATVEKQTGGKITNATFETQGGKFGYVVTAYAGGKMTALWVDPQSGTATSIAKPSADETAIETQDKADVTTLDTAKANLSQAVALAEEKAGGKAMDAQLKQHDMKTAISIDVLTKDGKMSTLWVDPMAGKLES